MQMSILLLSVLAIAQPESLGSGDHRRTVTVDDMKRGYLIHVPPKYDAKKPMPLVLALHGAAMDGKLMEIFTGLSGTADENNFIVVYPSGTGPGGFLLTWNAGLFPGELNKGNKTDDVKYLSKVLDDAESVLNVDRKRIYVTGLSNGAMMSYRLASEMSERIAAIAPVAGTMALEKYEPKRAISVLHIHGTKDTLVPYNGPNKKNDVVKVLQFRSVDDTIAACIKANGCSDRPEVSEIEPKVDKIKVTRKAYNNGKDGSEVVLYVMEDAGHVWPAALLGVPAFLGPTTRNISANEVIWDFFKKHALK
jgi:polyhydroxybutyrate depolymerase